MSIPIKSVIGGFLLMIAGCSGEVGYGIKVGKVTDHMHHAGYSTEQIFDAAKLTLDTLGVVTHTNSETGEIEGQIPPFKVRAEIKKGSAWLKLIGVEKEKGKWTRKDGEGRWYMTMDGKMIYRRGAQTLDEAVEDWSDAVSQLLP